MKKQAYNPFLPLGVCIPDGEPHVFGDRVYLFGSHEEEGGKEFCTLGYEFYSAPVNDLGNWSSRGVNYRAEQDPEYSEKYKYMYAPDVVRGNDGKYYLFYCIAGKDAFTSPIRVAVCDTPDGKYHFYGVLRNQDGSIFNRNIPFDPAVINDNGKIRLYYGWSLAVEKERLPADMKSKEFLQTLNQIETMMFGKNETEEPTGVMGAYTVELSSDMLTVITEPKRVVCGQFDSRGTSFENHAFFEGSSIRKIGDSYYFVYSSEKQHELCYATSKYPDKDFVYGGVIISNGDIGLNGRKENERICATGNNHGSIEKIGGQWYVFYHRQTHKTSFSRKACAEKITVDKNGAIGQTEMTSCGLNGGALAAEGEYPAVICSELTNGRMPHIDPQTKTEEIPHITHEGEVPYIAEIGNGTHIGYKYFTFCGETKILLTVRGGNGKFILTIGGERKEQTVLKSAVWYDIIFNVKAIGTYPLLLRYEGENVDFMKIKFERGI